MWLLCSTENMQDIMRHSSWHAAFVAWSAAQDIIADTKPKLLLLFQPSTHGCGAYTLTVSTLVQTAFMPICT